MITTLHPDLYHGHHKQPPFFEGWYYKFVNASETQRFAIIPGVFLGAEGHAFIQVLNGSTGESAYHTFPLEQFKASKDKMEVEIGPNHFSLSRLHLEIDRPDCPVAGDLELGELSPWPVTLTSPGIMGWYAWVPRMECYHGVLSFDHALKGSLAVNGEKTDFQGGKGYIEKDWGQSFPAGWVWFQSNHFDLPETCITASIAVIPWMGTAFPGFIVGFWQAGRLYRFATYTGARIEKLKISDSQVAWVISDRRYRLELLAQRARGGLLLGPTRVEMGKRVNETMLAKVDVRLSTRQGQEIFAGQGRNAGLEAHGELERLKQR